jgi:hypothetical protein
VMSHEPRIEQYTDGQLNINLVDPQTRQVILQSSTRGRLTKKDYENAQATLDAAVAEIFQQFPVASQSLMPRSEAD